MTKKVNARTVATDILSGKPYSELMEQHGLSAEQFDSLRASAEAAILLRQDAKHVVSSTVEEAELQTWTCPSCGRRHPVTLRECPQCAAIAKEPKPEPKPPEPDMPIPTLWGKANAWVRKPGALIATGALATLLLFAGIFAVRSFIIPGQIPSEAAGTSATQTSRLPRDLEVAVLASYNTTPNLKNNAHRFLSIHGVRIIASHRARTITPTIKKEINPRDTYCVTLKATWLQSKQGVARSSQLVPQMVEWIPSRKEVAVEYQSVLVFVREDGQIWVTPPSMAYRKCPDEWKEVCPDFPCQASVEELSR